MADALLSVIVLTRDEEANLPFLLDSLRSLCANVIIVDSGSTDRTMALAREAGCAAYEHLWTDHATQFNWALDNLSISTPWIMRMDADERLTPELARELPMLLASLPERVSGVLVKRQVWFWGRWIRHGGYYPTLLLRIWRTGQGRLERRLQDAHVVIETGELAHARHDIIDENHKNLSFWIAKHNYYADREVIDFITAQNGHEPPTQGRLFRQAGRRRWAKQHIYYRLPIFLRAFLYWFYRYIMLGGFLDGRAGLVFHFLQGFWYRFLVDAKIYEFQMRRTRVPDRS
jgi:glycosyltransferase involved in cell wall biosynthesis